MTVNDIEGSKRAVRKSGVLTKKATLFLADGQKLIVEATAQGAIFQVKLNNQVLAIKNVDNLNKAVKEIAGFVHKNSKSFQAKLRKMAERKQGQSNSGSRQAKLSTQQQLTEKQQCGINDGNCRATKPDQYTTRNPGSINSTTDCSLNHE